MAIVTHRKAEGVTSVHDTDWPEGGVCGPAREIGTIVTNEYGHFANPRGSLIQSIPCGRFSEALDCVVRLGVIE